MATTGKLAPAPATAAKILAAPLIVNTAPAVGNPFGDDFVSNFENYVETQLVPKLPGVALAVIANGKVKVLQAYGVKKVNSNDPINTDTLFRLASVSKTIGSTAGAMLVHDGLATWDTSITTVLPEVEFKNPKYGDQLTLLNILSQSTGLPTHTNDHFIEEGMSYDEVIRRLRHVNFVCPPGKCYAYQNVTYSLISNIIQKKTGKTYEQYVQEKLFDPLGMHTASFGMLGLKASNNYALPHVMTRNGWYTETITENYYRINPAAGANASITDMSQWLLAQMGHNPEVLSPATLNVLHNKVTRNTAAQSHYGTREGVTDTHYGLGWRIFDYRGDKNFVHHGGYVLGFRSEMVFNPELQIGMVILSNSNKLGGDVIFKFLDAYEDSKNMNISTR
ncbi:MAG TPA: serine hydrolase domain-containing protein [Cellvibrio sp.]|nr:serine hydrolase domain-containing protein [Cellvibrio sp.]